VTVEEFYDNIAEAYDTLRYGSDHSRQVAQIELDFIRPYLQKGSCLEVGAGTGRVTGFLVDCVDSVTAVDQSPQMLRLLRRNIGPRSNLKTEILDIYDLDRIEGYGLFDNVACYRVLPHLREAARALELLRDAVVADGMLFFDLWNSLGYAAILKYVGVKKMSVYTDYTSIRKMRAMIDMSELRVVARKGVGFPPLKLLRPFENLTVPVFDLFAQRILWVCQPK
jgi:SAM-dependent methyltransferase